MKGSRGVYLDRKLRELLFSRCYEKEGSLAAIARTLGYEPSSGNNGTIRDMWIGKLAIPHKRLKALARLAQISFSHISKKIIAKEENELSEDWVRVYSDYTQRRMSD